MAEALPFVQGALGLAQLAQTVAGPPAPPPAPKAPPTLGWDEAMRQATETLNPIYDERMQQTLRNVDKELIQRGFFGQLPGAALAGSRAADVERAKAAAIASLGGQMQTQSQEQALAQQRLAAEWAINQSNLWNQMQQQRMYYPLEHYKTTWEWPLETIVNQLGSGRTTPMTTKKQDFLTGLGVDYLSQGGMTSGSGLPTSMPASGYYGPGGQAIPMKLNPWAY